MSLVPTKLVSVDNLYIETGWETLENRRRQHILTLVYKIKNNLTPPYYSSLLAETTNTGYNMRNNTSLPVTRCRITLYSDSFLPYGIKQWNSLQLNVQSSTSVASFKAMIKPRTNTYTSVLLLR